VYGRSVSDGEVPLCPSRILHTFYFLWCSRIHAALRVISSSAGSQREERRGRMETEKEGSKEGRQRKNKEEGPSTHPLHYPPTASFFPGLSPLSFCCRLTSVLIFAVEAPCSPPVFSLFSSLLWFACPDKYRMRSRTDTERRTELHKDSMKLRKEGKIQKIEGRE